MKITLGKIAKLIEGELCGDPSVVIKGVASIDKAGKDQITFLANPKYQSLLEKSSAGGVIVNKDVDSNKQSLIKVDNPSLAFAQVVSLYVKELEDKPQEIDNRAIIDDTAVIGQGVAIGPNAVIKHEVNIGKGTVVYAGSYIGARARIGKNCLIYPNVTIREDSIIGDNVILHPGVVIGSDGFGFAGLGKNQKKIPQVGIVVIEDNVEIGANTTIDRARFDKTVIGQGTKIDNLVQIGHNVIIGANCTIVAQVGISGSTELGDEVVIAGQTGVAGHLTIGAKTVVAGRSGVTKSLPPNSKVAGFPAKPIGTAHKINACMSKLPQLYKKIRQLEKRLKNKGEC